MRVKSTVALATTALLAVALAACGGAGSSGPAAPGDTTQSLAAQTQYNAQPYDNIKDGGTLTTNAPEISAQFNIFQGDTTSYSRLVWNWYNPMLITFGPTGDVFINKDYVTDAKEETVDGNTKITYTINPKAVYNDGAPIDWTSFEATWKANAGSNEAYTVSSSDGYNRITTVAKGVDDRQAVVTFKGINVWWQGLFNNLLNPKALDPEVFNKGYVNTPHAEWGAGPYTVKTFDEGNGTITFERNPKWWGAKGKLDSRTIVAMDSAASINAFKNGQLDAVTANTADRYSQVKAMQGIDIEKSASTSVALFQLNSKTPVLADPLVRKAVMEGIDRAQLVKISNQGIDYEETPLGSLGVLPFQKGYVDNFSQAVTFSKEQAAKDLDAAGWKAGADGVRTKDGKPLTFNYVNASDNPVRKAIATATVAMLKDIGITLEYKQVPSSDFSKIISGRTFDMFYLGFSNSDPFGLQYFCQLYCSDSTLNLTGTGSPAFDEKAKALNTLPTADEQFAKSKELEVEAFKTYGLMPIQMGPTIFAVKKGLANYGSGLYFTNDVINTLPENIGWQK